MKKIVLLVLVGLILSGCARIHPQDEDNAVGVTNLFIKSVVRGDFKTAYERLMSPTITELSGMSQSMFQIGFEAMIEDRGKITRAIFDSYQAVPKKNEIQLYYNVTHEKSGEVIYHVVLEGHRDIGYKISIMDIGNLIPYPPGLPKHKTPERKTKHGIVEVQLQ
jgi:hypothetical protein